MRDRRKRSFADTASAQPSTKKVKVDVVIAAPAATASRSYTPPPVPTDPRKKPPAPVLPPVAKLLDSVSEKDDMGTFIHPPYLHKYTTLKTFMLVYLYMLCSTMIIKKYYLCVVFVLFQMNHIVQEIHHRRRCHLLALVLLI